eukprot:1147370-Prymnesium_polylepis.1
MRLGQRARPITYSYPVAIVGGLDRTAVSRTGGSWSLGISPEWGLEGDCSTARGARADLYGHVRGTKYYHYAFGGPLV